MRFFQREWADAWTRSVAAAEAFLAAPAGTVALVDNATVGIDVALRLAGLRPGDVVVTTDHGYPAVDANLAGWARRAGVVQRVVPIPLEADDDEVVRRIADAAEDARAVVVDHLASPTGRRFPVERLVPAVRERGAFVFVDGAHAPAQVPVDLGALAPDVWVGNVHKWACGPKSLALLYVHPDHHGRIDPVLPSSLPGDGFPANAAWQGTSDPGPMLVLPEVLAAAGAFLAPEVDARLREVADAGQRLLADALGVPAPRYPTGWMRTVPVPDVPAGVEDARRLHELIARDLGVEVAVTRFAGRLHLRASTHVYTELEDHARLAGGIARRLSEWTAA